MENIALDVHKHYTWARVENTKGDRLYECRLAVLTERSRTLLNDGVQDLPWPWRRWGTGTGWSMRSKPEEESRNWSTRGWRKVMMGNVNKSDKLDAKGMNHLQRNGTLPTVWIPPSSVRDARELPRTRMVLSRQRTQLKNRVHATLGKYGYVVEEVSDAFGKRGREIVMELSTKLPSHTQLALQRVLNQLDHLVENLKAIEAEMIKVLSPVPRPLGSRLCLEWARSWRW